MKYTLSFKALYTTNASMLHPHKPTEQYFVFHNASTQ